MLVAVLSDPLCLVQDSTLHRLFYFLFARARLQVKLAVERIQLKKYR
jgi:hypothetical protein